MNKLAEGRGPIQHVSVEGLFCITGLSLIKLLELCRLPLPLDSLVGSRELHRRLSVTRDS